MDFIRRLARLLERLSSSINNVLHHASGWLILSICILTTYSVVMRYAFDKPESFSDEVASYMLLYGCMLAIGYSQTIHEHVRVDFAIEHFPEQVKAFIFNFVGPLAGAAFCVFVTWQSWLQSWYYLQANGHSASSLAWPLFPIWVLLPIGYGLLALTLIAQMFSKLILSQVEIKDKASEGRQ